MREARDDLWGQGEGGSQQTVLILIYFSDILRLKDRGLDQMTL